MSSITLLGAFLGGVLTLLSPCSIMLLPAFFAAAFTSAGSLLARTGVFFLGLATTLVPLGAAAGSLGALLQQQRDLFLQAATVLVVILGLLLLLGVQIPLPVKQKSLANTSGFAVYGLGLVYGLAGVCAGPLLGAALTFAATSGNAFGGGVVLLCFAAGMALPLLLLALVWNRLPIVKKILRPRELVLGRWRNAWTNIIGGLLTVATGVMLLATHGTATVGNILGYSTQAKIEEWVFAVSQLVPDWLFLTVLLVPCGVAFAVWQARR